MVPSVSPEKHSVKRSWPEFRVLRDEQMGPGFWKNHLWLPTQEAFNKQESNRTKMEELKMEAGKGGRGKDWFQVRVAQL